LNICKTIEWSTNHIFIPAIDKQIVFGKDDIRSVQSAQIGIAVAHKHRRLVSAGVQSDLMSLAIGADLTTGLVIGKFDTDIPVLAENQLISKALHIFQTMLRQDVLYVEIHTIADYTYGKTVLAAKGDKIRKIRLTAA
jgi:hypothetical protein